jgi:hypothetical protein
VIPFAHINGIPVEETVLALSPMFALGVGAATAGLRAGIRRLRGQDGEPIVIREQPAGNRDAF